MTFKNKIIWITGASSGIGEACAYLFAEEKARLILTGTRKSKLVEVKEKCRTLGAECEILVYDLSDLSGIYGLVSDALNFFGAIDIMFNNAGISQRAKVADTHFDVDQKIMNVNYFAPVRITKLILPEMIKQGGGIFVTTASISGRFGFPLRSAYAASKHALYGFFESLQAEYYTDHIRSVMICPGRVRTRISFYALEKDGRPHGRMDAGQAGGISAEKAARKILKAIRNQKPEVLVGGKELLMVYLKRYIPSLNRFLARKIKAE
ncbi:MAG: SDR family oxidoreductase [Tannerella sp.]|jgi:short-subunit dehydrogenase|nr:SDR family oxidoreductase [Tannerella sp.]